jgi:hypothetical protein
MMPTSKFVGNPSFRCRPSTITHNLHPPVRRRQGKATQSAIARGTGLPPSATRC